LIKPGIYSYRFKVEDKEKVIRTETSAPLFPRGLQADPDSEKQSVEIPPIGDFNIFQRRKRSIPMIPSHDPNSWSHPARLQSDREFPTLDR